MKEPPPPSPGAATQAHSTRPGLVHDDELRLRFIAQSAKALSSAEDLESVARLTLDMAVPALADYCEIEIFGDPPLHRSRSTATRDGLIDSRALRGDARRRNGAADPRRRGHEDRRTAPMVLADLDSRHAAKAGMRAGELARLRSLGLASVVVMPLVAGADCLGTAILGSAAGSMPGGAGDLALYDVIGLRIGATIKGLALQARVDRLGDTLQRAMLPTALPRIPGKMFSSAYAPAAREAEVGGDWFDAFPLPDGRVAISIGDVAGHGLEAAVIMAEVRQTFRVVASEGGEPAHVLEHTNRLLLMRSDPQLVTAIFGVFDPLGDTFVYATAGHPPAVLGTPDGLVTVLPFSGIPLGIAPTNYEQWTMSLPAGSLLVMHTDGLTEFERDVLSAERRLHEAIAGQVRTPVDDSASALLHTVVGTRNRDDVAVLTLRLADMPVQRIDLSYSATPVAVPLIRQVVTNFAHTHRLSESKRFALAVAIGEAVSNVIEHAYMAQHGLVRVRAEIDGERVNVRIEDRGRWRPARSEGRGRGMRVMRSLVDHFALDLSQFGTAIDMSISLSDERQTESEG